MSQFSTGAEAIEALHQVDLNDLGTTIDWINTFVHSEFDPIIGPISNRDQWREIDTVFEQYGYLADAHTNGDFDETDRENHGVYVIGQFLSLVAAAGPVAFSMSPFVERCCLDWLEMFEPNKV